MSVWRRVCGLSQEAVGALLGWSQAMVSDVELGRWPDPPALHERLLWGMARYYGIVGMDEGPPKAVGPKRRRPRRKTVNPVDEYYKRIVEQSQAVKQPSTADLQLRQARQRRQRALRAKPDCNNS